MASELVEKIKAAIMPEDIREKCLKLLEKCPEEKLGSLEKILESYFEKRNKELAVILKMTVHLRQKCKKTCGI